MKRLCFLSPDLEHARQVVADLRNNGIAEEHIYALARHGVDMEDLPDAGPEADDFLAGYERGLALGGSAGALAGLTALAFPPAGIVIGGGFVLLTGLFGAGIGGLLTSMAGAAFPSSRLQEFEQAIEDGNILIMVDVPASEVDVFETLIRGLDPEVSVEGIAPPAKLVP
ncbi:DUF1269 domain-containing protein [Haliea sp. E1-2-M8]|uniref:DUF1269 domain-containing protein n=1 Tax=Haliea sp. E1-2-M8 TaxID=3064706 RepID=UPI00271753E8|nr:DUF1269 domain-containing protein [Haliea sp. E1-2-M8]MDO8861612.1 DUF1269 domain-containing protein [Haliea sp. E1-2-M8]